VNPNGPIGIFDSGLGGLTVCRAIETALPGENLIYLGDTARVPYGVKSPETVTRYSQEICDFLLRQEVKAIVVACNTASALALPKLREWYQVPLLGVLEPGVQAALQASKNHHIGVIGTEGTIRSESYAQAIRERYPEAKVWSRACPLFVPLVEEGWIDHEVTRRVVEIYLGEWRKEEVDTVILGCTHYPLLKGILQEVLGPEVRLVDSALETARALRALLESRGLVRNLGKAGSHTYFSTDAPDKMRSLAEAFLGHPLSKVGLTDLLS
jgi:glutamate racemase